MYYDNLTMLTDFYELTMMQGYYLTGMDKKIGVFDLYYRKNPSGNGYAVAAGLAQVIDYIKGIKFTEEDIDYLRGQKCFREEFLQFLRGFKFNGELYALPEGTVMFPGEPIIRVKASMLEAQFVETAMLTIINHQSLIATKAARVVWAAKGDAVLEFGLRRAQGPDSGIYGARAAVIAGCAATSNVLTGKMFGVPVRGTHAHSWVMSFPDELTAFREYARIFPEACILLVDTYDTLKSGVPNAIKIFTNMRREGIELKNYGIRLDSGDFAYISKQARKMLDDAGFADALISASSDLDEYLISELKQQGAEINVWGVGTSLITSYDCPAFGGVYKLAAESNGQGELEPKIKLSENVEKITNPGEKKIYRLYDKKARKIKADLVTLSDETIDSSQDLELFHPLATWKKMLLEAGTYETRELLVPVFINGQCVYESPTVMEIREYCKSELNSLWDEYKRLVNPHILPVDLSHNLWQLKQDMIKKMKS